MVFHRILDFKTRLDFYPASIYFGLSLNRYNSKTFFIISKGPPHLLAQGSPLILTFAA